MYDFPVQYGLGPTLLVSLGGEEGFASLYYSTFFANVLMIVLIAMITCKVVKPKHWYQRTIILLLYFVLILVPMSSPGDVNAPNFILQEMVLDFCCNNALSCIYFRKNAYFWTFLWILSFVWFQKQVFTNVCLGTAILIYVY